MRKIGINLYARSDIAMEEYVRVVKELGFDSVFCVVRTPEIMYETTELLAKVGLSYDTLHAPFRGMNALWYAGEAGDAKYAELVNCVNVCAEVGAPIAVIHLSSGIEHTPPTDVGRGRVSDLVNYAVGKGVSIAFENTRKLANLAWAFEEFSGVNNVGFCYDSGHEACFTPGREYLPIFGDRMICTHIHDNDCIKDLHLLPFDGKIDFDRVTNQIRKSGYQGTLMLEVSGGKEIYQHLTAEDFLKQAASIAKRLREMIDIME